MKDESPIWACSTDKKPSLPAHVSPSPTTDSRASISNNSIIETDSTLVDLFDAFGESSEIDQSAESFNVQSKSLDRPSRGSCGT